MSFLDHLEELRWTIIRIMVTFCIALLLTFPMARLVFMVLKEPLMRSAQYASEPEAEIRAPDAQPLQGRYRFTFTPEPGTGEGVAPVPDISGEYRVVKVAMEPQADGSTAVLYDIEPLEKAPGDRDILMTTDVAGIFSLTIRIAVYSALILCAPFLMMFIASFVFPGLTPLERKAIKRSLFFSLGLFFVGVLMAYHFTLPVALNFMWRLNQWLGVDPRWTVNSYIQFSMHVLFGFGLAFQLPVVMLVLGKMGLVDSRSLREKRRFAVVGCLVVGMVLTPPEVYTQVMMAVPLYLLYEMCIWLLYFSEKREKRNDDEYDIPPYDVDEDEDAYVDEEGDVDGE